MKCSYAGPYGTSELNLDVATSLKLQDPWDHTTVVTMKDEETTVNAPIAYELALRGVLLPLVGERWTAHPPDFVHDPPAKPAKGSETQRCKKQVQTDPAIQTASIAAPAVGR